MLNKLALIHGAPVIPDGWVCIYGERFSTAEPTLIFSRILENNYYYHVREVRAKWGAVAGSNPSIEIFRDLGNRAYQQGNLGVNAIELRDLTTPGDDGSLGDNPPRVILRPCIPLNMWFPPSSRLLMKITGHLTGDSLDLVVHGRYYLDPAAVI